MSGTYYTTTISAVLFWVYTTQVVTVTKQSVPAHGAASPMPFLREQLFQGTDVYSEHDAGLEHPHPSLIH